MSDRTCILCHYITTDPESAQIPSNIRALKDQRFAIWRCEGCASIHAEELSAAQLAAYYSHYPAHHPSGEFVTRLYAWMYARRLERFGLRREHHLLDYGAGNGALIRHLRSWGYAGAVGYDPHNPALADPGVLTAGFYDVVVLQDVIEHVPDPATTIREVAAYLRPGGKLFIGTPDAARLNLHLAAHLHSLHQPFHLHILSAAALRTLAEGAGLDLMGDRDTPYNTLIPGMNLGFFHFYAQTYDNMLDLAYEPYRFHPRLVTPRAALMAFFGKWINRRTEMMLIFGS
jgi:2-polyprenyl-3-methyl-5-hydroxy-6-metoxy-1,4-benzoquinol methylase